nr:MarR family transcriptional regulator [Eubacterium sp.]
MFESIYRLINKYNQKSRVAKHYGTEDLLYSAEVHMIEIIGSEERITTTKLAEILGITKGAVSQITRKLLMKDMILKEASKEKNNEVLISLTEKGRTVFLYHRNMHNEMFNKLNMILDELPEESKKAMKRMIRVIEESFDEM